MGVLDDGKFWADANGDFVSDNFSKRSAKTEGSPRQRDLGISLSVGAL